MKRTKKGRISQEHTSDRVSASHRCANQQNADAQSPNLTIHTLPEMSRLRMGITLDHGMVGRVKLFEFSAEEAISKTLVK